MATFTITTAVNVDTLVGRTGGDTFAINGGFLTWDEDSRYGLNANTSATIGPLTPSATLGGSVQFDGRAIWLIPYTGGSGNVPAYNTAITKGGATGKLIGVHSALNAAPTTPGSAMPATGFIRVKQWNGVLYGTGALGGLTATAAAGENVGWIVPVGQEGSLALVSSLNQTPAGAYDGSFCKGDWYTVGTTSGSRATSYQIPSNGESVWHGGVMVDRAAATAITAASWSGGVATFTSTAHGLADDDRVMVDAILPRAWRTVDTQRCTVIDANTFSIPMVTNPGSYTSGGTVAAQELWPTTDSLNTKVGTAAYNGQHCWVDSATGLLRFGNDGTTSTGGLCPASGLVIRLGNVMTQNSPSATKTINAQSTTLATRWRYYNGNAGIIKVDHMSGAWSASVFQTGKYVQMSDSTVCNQISCASQAADSSFTNVCVGGNSNTATTQAFIVSQQYVPVTLLDCTISTGEIGGRFPLSLSTAYGVTVDRCRFTGTGDRTSATYGINCNIGRGLTVTRSKFGPHAIATASQFSDVSISDSSFYSSSYDAFNPIGTPTPTVNLGNLSADWEITDMTPLGPTPLGRAGLLTTASGSDRPIFRNWGTYAAPIDQRMNGTQVDKSWSRVTTTCTVTETAHPYRAGDQVVVFQSSNTTAIILTVKTITAVTANTFDFACVNSGTTSGKIGYYVGNATGCIVLSATADAVIQNVHCRGATSNPLTQSSTSYGCKMDNVTLEPLAYSLMPQIGANDMQVRSLYETDYPIIAGIGSIFGTHFSDVFVREPGTAVPGQAAAVTGVSWTRVTTVCTVTSPNHGLLGNVERIWVENSSVPAAVANGWGVSALTLVVDDKDTFHFTCVNSGATSGTLDYWFAGDSQFRVLMTEPSDESTGQADITVSSGNAGFTGSGTMVLPAVGDQATWETPDFIMGYDSFAHTPTIPYGTGITTAINAGQFDIAYDLDRGSGFTGTWRNAAYYRAGGGGTSGTAIITMTSTTGVQVNDYVSGVGVGTGAKVVSIDSATQITVTVNNAATVSGTLLFWYTPNETTFPSTGVKFKVRVTANTAQTAAFFQIDLPLLSSSTSRQRLYSQLTQYTLTFTGLQSGSDIRIMEAGTVTSLLDADAVSGTTYDYTYYYTTGTYVDVQVLKDGYKPFRYEGYLLDEADADFLVQQVVARNEGT
jgi:hypothetical protein